MLLIDPVCTHDILPRPFCRKKVVIATPNRVAKLPENACLGLPSFLPACLPATLHGVNSTQSRKRFNQPALGGHVECRLTETSEAAEEVGERLQAGCVLQALWHVSIQTFKKSTAEMFSTDSAMRPTELATSMGFSEVHRCRLCKHSA